MAAKKNCKNCFHYKACKEGANRNGFWDIKYTERECKHFLSTADVAEVKHGEWILHNDGSGTCKVCGRHQKNIWDMCAWQKYCGHCGAKMDKGEINNEK